MRSEFILPRASGFRTYRPAVIMALFCAAATALFSGCGGDVWPDRSPATAENIRIDSVKFLPLGRRFVLEDSATRVGLVGYHAGYKCSEILEMGLEDAVSGNPAALKPRSRVRLPAAPDCPLDTSARGRDTVIIRKFGAGLDFVRLANSSGKATDSARVVRGRFSLDSLNGPLGIARTISKGPWTFRDSSGLAARMLFGDSLTSCQFLDRAEFSGKDTVMVRLSYVTLDPVASPDSCRGPARQDSVSVRRTVPDSILIR